MLSVNIALAHMNSEFEETGNFSIRYETVNGNAMDEPFVANVEYGSNEKGETLEMALALNWTGSTMIKDLSYTVGISGYRYIFESERPNVLDIHESMLSYKLGVSYAF